MVTGVGMLNFFFYTSSYCQTTPFTRIDEYSSMCICIRPSLAWSLYFFTYMPPRSTPQNPIITRPPTHLLSCLTNRTPM